MIPKPGVLWLRLRHGYRKASDYLAFLFSPLTREKKRLVIGFADATPAAHDLVTGGRVKLGMLARNFQTHHSRFSILYLVSSALPSYPRTWLFKCRLAGIPVVLNMNGVAYPVWAGKAFKMINRPIRLIHRKADLVLYQSEFARQGALRFLGNRENKLEILHNAVDTEFFHPGNRNNHTDPFILLVMGSHHFRERVSRALETLKLLDNENPECRLIIAGRLAWNEKAEEETLELIRQLGVADRVQILGPYTQEQAPAIYRKAHLLLHLQYNDVCPTVPMEAMACGLPVIASASGGMPELLQEPAGICLPVSTGYDQYDYPSPDEICRAIRQIIPSWEEKSRLATSYARERFGASGWIEKHQAAFRALTDLS